MKHDVRRFRFPNGYRYQHHQRGSVDAQGELRRITAAGSGLKLDRNQVVGSDRVMEVRVAGGDAKMLLKLAIDDELRAFEVH